MIGPFGRLRIGPTGAQVTFTCDPRDYKPWEWPKRVSIHQGIGGSITIQDFGTYMKDNVVELSGPEDAFMDPSTVAQIHAMYRTRGAVYLLNDWEGNEYEVFIEDFKPVANERLPGYAYTMRLRVLSIHTLFGSSYTGS